MHPAKVLLFLVIVAAFAAGTGGAQIVIWGVVGLAVLAAVAALSGFVIRLLS